MTASCLYETLPVAGRQKKKGKRWIKVNCYPLKNCTLFTTNMKQISWQTCLDITCNQVRLKCNHLSSFDELIKRLLADCESCRADVQPGRGIALLLAIKGFTPGWLHTMRPGDGAVLLYTERKSHINGGGWFSFFPSFPSLCPSLITRLWSPSFVSHALHKKQ